MKKKITQKKSGRGGRGGGYRHLLFFFDFGPPTQKHEHKLDFVLWVHRTYRFSWRRQWIRFIFSFLFSFVRFSFFLNFFLSSFLDFLSPLLPFFSFSISPFFPSVFLFCVPFQVSLLYLNFFFKYS